MASDVTSLSAIIHQAKYSGLNCVVVEASAATNTDWIDLNDLLEPELLGKRVKFVHYAIATHTPYGTAVQVPVVLTTGITTVSDRITIGGSISGNKIIRVIVYYE